MISKSELAQLRRDEKALQPDTCKVTRPSQGTTLDESTGSYTTSASIIYEGRCRVTPLGLADRTVIFGEEAVDLIAYRAVFPYDAPAFVKDDIVEMTDSADTQLIGRLLEVHSYEAKTLQIKRVVICQEVR